MRDEATRRWLFTQSHPWIDWYRSQASLDGLVAHAPLVEVVFPDGEP